MARSLNVTRASLYQNILNNDKREISPWHKYSDPWKVAQVSPIEGTACRVQADFFCCADSSGTITLHVALLVACCPLMKLGPAKYNLNILTTWCSLFFCFNIMGTNTDSVSVYSSRENMSKRKWSSLLANTTSSTCTGELGALLQPSNSPEPGQVEVEGDGDDATAASISNLGEKLGVYCVEKQWACCSQKRDIHPEEKWMVKLVVLMQRGYEKRSTNTGTPKPRNGQWK